MELWEGLTGFILPIIAGVIVAVFFYFLEKYKSKQAANNVYTAMLKRLERMEQIIKEHKDGQPYELPSSLPEELKGVNPANIVIKKYYHLVRTEGMLYSLFYSHLDLLSPEIIDKIDKLHDTVDSRTDLTDRLQADGRMHEVEKVDLLVVELKQQITNLKETKFYRHG